MAGQLLAPLDRGGDGVQRAGGALVGGGAAAQQLRLPAHDHEQVVEVVGDPTRELAERLHLLRLGQPLVGALELELGVPSLGDVARDLRKAKQLAVRVADRVDDDVRPEQSAVLAHPPTLGLVAALLGRRAERAVSRAGRAIGLGVEDRDVPADDLVGRVALDPLGAGVPADDLARGVEHDQRIVDDAGGEETRTPRSLLANASWSAFWRVMSRALQKIRSSSRMTFHDSQTMPPSLRR